MFSRMMLRLFAVCVLFYITQAKLDTLSLDVCGTSHGCWAFPANCEDAISCHGIVRWQKTGSNKYRFEMQGRDPEKDHMGRYISVGFSDDPWMGNDTVFECVVDGGFKGDVFVSINIGAMNQRLLDASNVVITKKEAGVRDGQVQCAFEIDLDAGKTIVVDADRTSFTARDLSATNSWYLLYASGSLASSGAKLPHPLDSGNDFFPWVTTEKIDLGAHTVVHKMKH